MFCVVRQSCVCESTSTHTSLPLPPKSATDMHMFSRIVGERIYGIEPASHACARAIEKSLAAGYEESGV